MIIDSHNHIGKRKGLTFLVDDLLKEMDKNQIDKAIVFSMVESIDNLYVAKSVNTNSDRLIGFITINPWQEDAEDEIRRYVEKHGMQGIKLHPLKHGFMLDDHSILDSIFELCSEHKLCVLSYGAAEVSSAPIHFEEMASTYSDVPFIMAHMGYMYDTNSAIDVAYTIKNVYLETSGVFVRAVQKAIKKVGCKKIIFGSDTPKEEFSYSLERIYMATGEERERKSILGENIQNLLEINNS